MLEKQRQKKKAIGTLDVAFKKRFFALNNQAQGLDGVAPEGGKVARKFLECNMIRPWEVLTPVLHIRKLCIAVLICPDGSLH